MRFALLGNHRDGLAMAAMGSEAQHAASGHDMRLVGTGNAEVFRDGQRQDATWTRASDGVAFTFTNRQGEQIKFNPGQTWIHIIPTEWTVSSK